MTSSSRSASVSGFLRVFAPEDMTRRCPRNFSAVFSLTSVFESPAAIRLEMKESASCV
jgi:hypothetical protein